MEYFNAGQICRAFDSSLKISVLCFGRTGLEAKEDLSHPGLHYAIMYQKRQALMIGPRYPCLQGRFRGKRKMAVFCQKCKNFYIF